MDKDAAEEVMEVDDVDGSNERDGGAASPKRARMPKTLRSNAKVMGGADCLASFEVDVSSMDSFAPGAP
jgi:hypothetical protein